MVITLPQYTGFSLASVHDIAIRVGNDMPDDEVDPSTINMLCSLTSGALSNPTGADLGSPSGPIVRVPCTDGPVTGRVVTIQIRWALESYAAGEAWR